MSDGHRADTMRFIAPIVLESAATTLVGLVFSALIGHVSASSLAATNMANMVFNMLATTFAMVYIGGSTVAAHLTGAGDYDGTSAAFEQTFLLTLVLTLSLTALCYSLSRPTMRLLLPSAEAGFFSEALLYYQLQLISMPFYIYQSCTVRLMRATGDSRMPMVCTIVANLAQIAFGYLFIVIIPLGVAGAALAYVGCRLTGAVFGHIVIARSTRSYHFSLRRALKPNMAMIRRILRIGYPTSIETLFTNAGYTIATSMVMGLGTFEGTIYSIATTLGTFGQLPGSVCNSYISSVCGRELGAGNPKGAIRAATKTWLTGLCFTGAVCAAMALLGTRVTRLYSTDPDAIAASASLLWLILAQYLCTATESVYAGCLRVAGAPKFVMVTTIVSVWAVRLPLTYLLCYVLDWGAVGVLAANALNIAIRGVASLLYFNSAKWKTARV